MRTICYKYTVWEIPHLIDVQLALGATPPFTFTLDSSRWFMRFFFGCDIVTLGNVTG